MKCGTKMNDACAKMFHCKHEISVECSLIGSHTKPGYSRIALFEIGILFVKIDLHAFLALDSFWSKIPPKQSSRDQVKLILTHYDRVNELIQGSS